MPPKKAIKLKVVEKTEKPITVDSDDVDIPDEEDKKPIDKKIKKQITSSIISKPINEIPEPIIKDETEINLDESEKEVPKVKDVKISKPNKIIKKTETIVIDESETEPKLESKTESKSESKTESKLEHKSESKIKQVTKNKTLLKQTESSFDMFGDDKDDYREILMKYDYTKNKTLPKITKYERALIIGKRAKQIEDGANPNIKVKPGQGAIEIAEEELRQRVIPLIIKRPNGNTFEYWKPADMEVLMD
jgi:DNA-directed RNA polymerase subunit K/omega